MSSDGFVFATTGPKYTALAIRAAKSVQLHHPYHPIDLFTDQEVDDPIFAKIHKLSKTSLRPKMEALHQSRFERTIFLDADLFVVADICDVFDVLHHFDLAATHDQERNSEPARTIWNKPIPPAFPQFNNGMLGIRRSPKTIALLKAWDDAFHLTNQLKDQPSFRELVYESDIRIATLPPEYNLVSITLARSWDSKNTAPRIFHHWMLQKTDENGNFLINSVEELLGKKFSNHMRRLKIADHTINPENSISYFRAFCDRFPGAKLPELQKTPVSIRFKRWVKQTKRSLKQR